MKQLNTAQALTWFAGIILVGVQHQYPQYSPFVTDIITMAAAAGLHLHLTPDDPPSNTTPQGKAG